MAGACLALYGNLADRSIRPHDSQQHGAVMQEAETCWISVILEGCPGVASVTISGLLVPGEMDPVARVAPDVFALHA